MKKTFGLLTAVAVILSVITVMSGCSENKSAETASAAEQTTAAQSKSDNPLTGTWQIENEEGKKDNLFSYIFEDEGKVFLAMDNVEYAGEYSLSKDAQGRNTLTTQLYYNLNGTYVYEFTDDRNKMTLKNTSENGTDYIMVKTEDYNPMPTPLENPVVDEKLTGSWKDKEGTGVSYEFYDNGTMYCNSYGVMLLYSQYSAENGKIKLTYKQGTTVEDTYDYSFEGDTLIIDGTKYERV